MFQTQKNTMQHAPNIGIDGRNLLMIGKARNSSSCITPNTLEFQQFIEGLAGAAAAPSLYREPSADDQKGTVREAKQSRD